MKKRIKHRSSSASLRVGPDIAGLINRMQQQLVSLEEKIDALIGRSPLRPFEEKNYSGSVRPAGPSHRYNERREDNRFRERTLHKAICADCHKECEVPFKPSGGRPVYCKGCFSKRKNGGSFKARPDNRPGENTFKISHPDKHRGGETQRPAVKKKPNLRHRKKRT